VPASVSVSTGEGLTDERALVDRARAGDAEAQGAIFDFYWPKIVRYAYAHCGNLQDAEDLASEVFLRMVEAIGRFQWRDNVPFTAWLFRIARNQIVNHYRRRGDSVPWPEEGSNEPAAPDDPQQMVEQHLALDEVYQVAQKLPILQQEVIRLRFGADLSLADTARILDKKENNVKQLQHKAIGRMKQLLNVER
jgi:RNA polymerase sigma-70 factor (ECF subfamily)